MSLKIWHVHTSDGRTYGVAASNASEAKVFAQVRLTNDESDAHPVKAEYAGTGGREGGWTYGNVIGY